MGIVRIIHRGFAMHVDHCPIRSREWKGKPYANVIDDCSGCTHCKGIETSYNDWVDCDLMKDDPEFLEELKTPQSMVDIWNLIEIEENDDNVHPQFKKLKNKK